MGKSLQLSIETWNFLALTISYPTAISELTRARQTSSASWGTWFEAVSPEWAVGTPAFQPQQSLKITGKLPKVYEPQCLL